MEIHLHEITHLHFTPQITFLTKYGSKKITLKEKKSQKLNKHQKAFLMALNILYEPHIVFPNKRLLRN